MATAAAAREARRKKIVDRGSDRLALITGRVHTLPPPLSSVIPPSDLSPPPDLPDPLPPLSDHTTVPSNDGNGDFGSTLSNHDAIIDRGHGEISLETPFHECGTTISKSSRDLASDVNDNMQPGLASSTNQEPIMSASGSNQQSGKQARESRFVTPSQISSAFAASQRSRLFCSVTIGLLVVLSYLGCPLPGCSMIKNIKSFKPLYLVLVTNASLVLARLLSSNHRGYERSVGAEWKIPSAGGYDWAEQASKVLEAGLVMQKAIDALFMDCSIYVIIIICGLSFVSKSAA